MVEFNTRVFTEDDGKIIGAEVTVYNDSGDKLGLIDIADAETLEEMQQQLAVIDETYFTEERLEEILANSEEDNVINATKLSGFLSSDFAKVSQLSSYALASHTHSKSQITDLYDYQIYANNYNPTIDGNVIITVKVTNRATGNPVVGVSVPVLKNNESWQSGTTGVNGTFSLSYTCDSWGLTTFSANTANIQINTTGTKLIKQSTNGVLKLYRNDNVMTLTCISTNNDISFPTTWTDYSAGFVPSQYRPKASMVEYNVVRMDTFWVVNPNGDVSKRTTSSSQVNNINSYTIFTWSI